MTKSKLVGLLYGAWKDMDRVIEGLTEADAVKQHFDGSSFAWTYAHTTNQVDVGVNVRFQERPPHQLIARQEYRFGGSGSADDWGAIQGTVAEVRGVARDYLDEMGDEELSRAIPYPKSTEGMTMQQRNGR